MAILSVNGKSFDVEAEADTPLLWVLRENLGLTGTKYGCGIAQCGACTVQIDGGRCAPASVQLSATPSARKSPLSKGWPRTALCIVLQRAWIEYDVPQCGYCQSGMIKAVAALLEDKPSPSDADIDDAIRPPPMNGRSRRRSALSPRASSRIRRRSARPASRRGRGRRRQTSPPPADREAERPAATGRSPARVSSGSTPPTRPTGKMVYGIDVKLPGMLDDSIKDCPVFGARLKSYDESQDRHLQRREKGRSRE